MLQRARNKLPDRGHVAVNEEERREGRTTTTGVVDGRTATTVTSFQPGTLKCTNNTLTRATAVTGWFSEATVSFRDQKLRVTAPVLVTRWHEGTEQRGVLAAFQRVANKTAANKETWKYCWRFIPDEVGATGVTVPAFGHIASLGGRKLMFEEFQAVDTWISKLKAKEEAGCKGWAGNRKKVIDVDGASRGDQFVDETPDPPARPTKRLKAEHTEKKPDVTPHPMTNNIGGFDADAFISHLGTIVAEQVRVTVKEELGAIDGRVGRVVQEAVKQAIQHKTEKKVENAERRQEKATELSADLSAQLGAAQNNLVRKAREAQDAASMAEGLQVTCTHLQEENETLKTERTELRSRVTDLETQTKGWAERFDELLKSNKPNSTPPSQSPGHYFGGPTQPPGPMQWQ